MKARQIALRILGAWLLAAVAVAATATAQKNESRKYDKLVTIHLDPAQTEIRWSLGAALHTVHGTFRLKDGTLAFDPQTGAAQGELVVCLATGESGSQIRDSRMHEEVLESAQYPQVVFRPERVVGAIQPGSVQNVTVTGTFRIHGIDHPFKLDLQVQINGTAATAATRFAVPYVQWGMKDPSTFMLHVEKEVNVQIVSKGSVDWGKAQNTENLSKLGQ